MTVGQISEVESYVFRLTLKARKSLLSDCLWKNDFLLEDQIEVTQTYNYDRVEVLIFANESADIWRWPKSSIYSTVCQP